MLLVTSFVVILYSLLGTTILVKFDGSLRFPSDPGFPTRSLESIAACAAYITADTDSTTFSTEDVIFQRSIQSSRQPCAFLGGKLVDSRQIQNSAESEYEGLILGLEGLFALLTAAGQGYPRPPGMKHHIKVSKLDVVTIQGDCKTVIQQMRGRSRPRKLERHHSRAHQLVERLLPLCNRIQFEHIPRSENCLCDQLCIRMILQKEMITLQQAWIELHDMALEAIGDDKNKNTALEATTSLILASSSSSSSVVSPNATSTPCNSKITEYLARHFSPSCSNLICISARPVIYRWLALIARNCNDNESLIEVGKRLESEARDGWPLVRSNGIFSKVETLSQQQQQQGGVATSRSSFEHERLLVEALVYVTSGLNGVGRSKEAAQISRRNRYILNKFSWLVNETTAFLNGGLQVAHPDEIRMSLMLKENTRFENSNSNWWSEPVKIGISATNESACWKNNEPLWVQHQL
jgi:Reverse transcriptase-like